MKTIRCIHCQQEIQMQREQTMRFCPLCGKPLAAAEEETSPLEKQLEREKNPKRKHALIQQALEADPDDLAANRALLFHGRLHEPMARGGKGIDFSIVKCHLMSAFETPDRYTEAELAGKVEELFRHPQLLRTMALSGDPEAFLEGYLHRLAREYIDLFVRGDTRNSTVILGFPRSPESSARRCAEIVSAMLEAVRASDRLEDGQRMLLVAALRDGYAQVFPSYGRFLDA